MARFSVIIPIYNAEKYLKECLDSVVNQNFNNYEIVLVDDGSIDNSPTICNEYAQKYNNIKFFSKENGGATSARKFGLEKCCGEYIILIDSDDYIRENLLVELNEIIDKFHPEIIRLNYCKVYNEKRFDYYNLFKKQYFGQSDVRLIREKLIYDKDRAGINGGIGACSLWLNVVLKKQLVKYQIDVPNYIRNGEDMAVTAPLLYNAGSIYFTDTIDYFYRDNPLSTVHTIKKDELKRYKVLIDYLLEKLPIEKWNAVYVYVISFLHNYIFNAARALPKKEFLEWANQEVTPFFSDCINKAKVYKPTLKDKLKIYLLKNKKFKSIRFLSRFI